VDFSTTIVRAAWRGGHTDGAVSSDSVTERIADRLPGTDGQSGKMPAREHVRAETSRPGRNHGR
jgi:hypothetical protein